MALNRLLLVLACDCGPETGPGPSGRRPATGLRAFGTDLHVHTSIGSNDTETLGLEAGQARRIIVRVWPESPETAGLQEGVAIAAPITLD